MIDTKLEKEITEFIKDVSASFWKPHEIRQRARRLKGRLDDSKFKRLSLNGRRFWLGQLAGWINSINLEALNYKRAHRVSEVINQIRAMHEIEESEARIIIRKMMSQQKEILNKFESSQHI